MTIETRTRMELAGNTIYFYTSGLEGTTTVTIHRTYRVPDTQSVQGLPPSLGTFPMVKVEDVKSRLPADMVEKGGVLIPVYPYEAMWFSFSGRSFRPSALQIAAGKVNAITGNVWDGMMDTTPQNFVVIGGNKNPQPWLDGWRTEGGVVRQFVASVLGKGQTVEFQVTGKETEGGIQLLHVEAGLDKFPVETPAYKYSSRGGFLDVDYSLESCLSFGGGHSYGMSKGFSLDASLHAMPASYSSDLKGGVMRFAKVFKGEEKTAGGLNLPLNATMGLGAGGKIEQKIYPSEYDISVWDSNLRQKVWIHMVNPVYWTELTGQAVPTSPIREDFYRNRGWWNQASVWFKLHDEVKGDVGTQSSLAGVQSVQQIAQKQGEHVGAQSTPQTPWNTVHLGAAPSHVIPAPTTTKF